uniref:Uncharacterized protein n=1 Tax=Oncorhynchus kisutch TaxID=8019 RepID=A0A8C7F0L4_ONCKI
HVNPLHIYSTELVYCLWYDIPFRIGTAVLPCNALKYNSCDFALSVLYKKPKPATTQISIHQRLVGGAIGGRAHCKD